MKEEIEKMYVQALIDDLAPNVFADQVLRLFGVVGQSEQLPCAKCENGLIWSKDRLKARSCDCGK